MKFGEVVLLELFNCLKALHYIELDLSFLLNFFKKLLTPGPVSVKREDCFPRASLSSRHAEGCDRSAETLQLALLTNRINEARAVELKQ